MSSNPTRQPMAQSPTSRVWSHNTTYTGAAGIHSEVGPGASVRNSLATRRVSNTMTTEETILKKQMHSFDTSKKSLENSMLAYSQKMKRIVEKKRSEAALADETEQNTLLNGVSASISKKEGKKPVKMYVRNKALPAVSDFIPESSIQRQDVQSSKSSSHMSESSTEVSSRMSVDSGISVDMRSESSDAFSDAYSSDTEVHKWGRSSTGADLQSLENKKGSEQGNKNRPRHGKERRYRFKAEKPELATVVDTEISLQEKNSPDLNQDTEEPCVPTLDDSAEHSDVSSSDGTPEDNFTISAFPEPNSEPLVPRLCLDTITEDKEATSETRVLNPLSNNRGYLRYKYAPRGQIPNTLAKPKATNSPSLNSIRVRRRVSKAKVVTKPFHQTFKYSDAVESAIKSVQPPATSTQSPTLPNIDLDELRQCGRLSNSMKFVESSPEFMLYRERCLSSSPLSSEPSPPPQPSKKRTTTTFMSTLESVDEHDSLELRSVLKSKKQSVVSSREKKSVNFFLPDIHKKPNTIR